MLLNDLQQVLLLILILRCCIKCLYECNASLSSVINAWYVLNLVDSRFVTFGLMPLTDWYFKETHQCLMS